MKFVYLILALFKHPSLPSFMKLANITNCIKRKLVILIILVKRLKSRTGDMITLLVARIINSFS